MDLDYLGRLLDGGARQDFACLQAELRPRLKAILARFRNPREDANNFV